MTHLFVTRKLTLAMLSLAACGLAYAQASCIEGETIYLEPKIVSTAELLRMAQSPETRATCTPCQLPNPNFPPQPNVPAIQSPFALGPFAFWPTTTTANSAAVPPQTVGLTFVAGNQGINPDIQGTPPDPMGVIGPDQFVMTLNQGLVSFDRQGNRDGILDVNPATFLNLDGDFAQLIATSDPRIRYDKFTDRFFYIILSRGLGAPVFWGFSIAVSDSGVLSESTMWKVVNIYVAGNVPDSQGCPGDQGSGPNGVNFDYPSLGIDKHALYIAADQFYNFGSSVYQTAYVVQKESLLGDGPAIATAFRGISGPHFNIPSPAVQGVDNFDDNPEFGYFVSTALPNLGELYLWRVINPGSTKPSLTPLIPVYVINTGDAAPNGLPANYPGNTWGTNLALLQCLDGRLMMAHIRNNQLYTTHGFPVDINGVGSNLPVNGGTADRQGCRWYQIDVSGTATSTPTLMQAGTIWDSTTVLGANADFYYFPAIMTNKRGDLTLCATVSGTNTPTSAFFAGRLASDPLGQLRIGASLAQRTYAQGGGIYTRAFGTAGGQRWGDYSYTSLDPADDMTMWTIQEIATDGLETMVVARLDAPAI